MLMDGLCSYGLEVDDEMQKLESLVDTLPETKSSHN